MSLPQLDKKLKALVIDDDPETLSYLEVVLRDLGLGVTVSRKPPSSRFSIRGTPDLIFLDMMLPDQDGVQVIESFVQARIESALVLMSACPDHVLRGAENFARMSGLKVLGSMHKPVHPQNLEQLLDPLLARSQRKPDIEEQEFFRLAASGSLVNYYEPVIDAQRAAVAELEVQARLHHPKMGIIGPSGLWDTAEAFAASDRIQARLLDSSVGDAVKFAEQGFRLPIACNVAANQLGQSDFPDRLLARCRELRLLPSSVRIEVAESDIRQNLVAVLGSMTRLGLRGVQIGIDGYDSSALAGGMLARLPVESLKLSHNLVAATLRDGDARSRVVDIVEYAGRHDLQVIAYGTETNEHLGLLLDLGVKQFQGSVFTQPRPLQEMVYWLRGATGRLAELGITSALQSAG